jgi:glycine betaine catabolism B
LHDNLRVGASLFADGPHGKFTCIGDDGGPYLLISGGSGITPGMAMSRWLCDTTPGADICFLHFARTPDDFIFEHELKLMQRQVPGFRCVFVCGRTESEHRWTGPVGHISPELLTEMVPDFKSRRIYLCGPVPFMEVTRSVLEKLNFDIGRFHQESFGGVPRDAKAKEAQASRVAKVVFSASKIEVDCKESDYLLDLALDRGLQAAFSCRAGQCGVCKITLLEGKVTHDCTDSLTADDLENGIILACQARPIGSIAIDQ